MYLQLHSNTDVTNLLAPQQAVDTKYIIGKCFDGISLAAEDDHVCSAYHNTRVEDLYIS